MTAMNTLDTARSRDDGLNAGPTVAIDRRRPGRPAAVAPALIPLLRGHPADPAAMIADNDDPDQLSSMRGIALAIVCSAGLVFLAVYIPHVFR